MLKSDMNLQKILNRAQHNIVCDTEKGYFTVREWIVRMENICIVSKYRENVTGYTEPDKAL